MRSDNIIRGAQRREVGAQLGMVELHDPLRAWQVTQRVDAQVRQPGIGRQPVDHQRLGGTGQYGLPAVREVAQPRGSVDGGPGVVAGVAQLDLPGVHAGA
ncbi:hypothetical protein MMAN_33480 [Mycobacterium mantenii]|uniref:Uncharacterized protein n=1 Tax=Mycobacterium mantenii TaxID=560555 RepID=A0A1X0FWU2_MYCNT|nr:hypothetical protein [Mycobacterium mantenii]ORB06244.1 hypothetical protein BST30_11860 [Mycobacterium mantenii]BBY39214.1 hypothetical protein MMAN_33480 [Mycobacterium mantenii]